MLRKWLLFITVLILPLSLFGCSNNGTIPKISTSEVPSVSSQPGWTLFPSGNQVNALITRGNYLWAATYGGVVRWNLDDGSYRIFTVQDGLPDNRVDAIDQDSRGNILAATGFQISRYDGVKWTTLDQRLGNISQMVVDHSGNVWVFALGEDSLKRFDGNSWKTFSVQDGLPSPLFVSGMAIDHDGNLWASLLQGIARYDEQSWRIFTTADGIASNIVYSLFVDSQNNLWCGTNKGVSRYNGSQWQNFVPDSSPSGNEVTSITEDNQGNLWFGNFQCVNRFDGTTWQTFTTAGLRNPRLLAVDLKGNLWCDNRDGISRFDGQSWQTFGASDGVYGYLTASVADQKGNPWLGTSQGIKRYDGKQWHNLMTSGAPVENVIRAMFKDKNGNLWFGTDRGISRSDGKSWQSFTEADGLALGYISPSGLFQDSQGNIWVACTGGFNRYDGKSWRKFDAKDGIDTQYLFSVSSIAQDKSGNLWFGTLYSKPISMSLPGSTPDPDINKQPEGGIYRFDGQHWQKFTTKDGLASNKVQAMVKDDQGNLWFGTDQGASRFDGTNWTTFTRDDGLASNAIQSIFKDKSGNLWFSTDSGISRFDGTSWQSFPLLGFSNGFNVITEDTKGIIWFGGNGILRFDGQSWVTITIPGNGPLQGSISDLAVGRDGNLWIGTNQGLVRYDGKTFQTFPIRDGLQFNQISEILVDADASVWCATAYGLARFSPK